MQQPPSMRFTSAIFICNQTSGERRLPMLPWKMMGRLLPFFAISLSACQSPQVQTRLVAVPPPRIPATLLIPTEGPYRPATPATQRDAAYALEVFAAALAACNADKKTIAEILDAYADLAGALD